MSNKRRFLYFLAIALSIIYLVWRIFFTIPWHSNLFTLIFALLLVISEILSNSTGFILIFFRMLSTKKKWNLTMPKYSSTQPLPDIDIIIVTHNESVDLLRKTINAATFMDYPDKSKVHIVVSDDGNRPEVQALAKHYHINYSGMENNKHAKSGNINNTLEKFHSPLFAIFDTDMIPFSTFLRNTVPLFTENFQQLEDDPDHTDPLGFVQTPQSFYNADIFQFNLFSEKIIPNEQDFFSRDVNVLNGGNKRALFTGSNAVFLRKAVDEVGGFPTDTITEDFELGTMLNMAGYISLATKIPQSSGITPIDMKGVIKQRTRWARGVIQSCRNLHIFTNPHLTMINRIILLNTYFYWWAFFRRMIYMIAPILYALFKIQVVNANFWILMVIWAPGYFLLHYVMGDTSGIKDNAKIRNERWGEVQETFFAPYLFIPVILESIGIKAKKFKVTSKNVTYSLKDKLYILPYLILWGITFIAIIKFNYGKYGSEILVGSVITFWLLMHFINLSMCLFISLGRPVYRKSERFIRKVSGKIQLKNGKYYPIMTEDVSEGGIAFKITQKDNSEIQQEDNIRIILQHRNFSIHLAGKIARISNRNNQPIYSAQVQVPSDENRDHYLQIIYDGSNKTLPSVQDTWVTPFDELYMNLVVRARAIERKISSRFNRF
ncbi:glycosyl transferase [Companilactobacillus paralimentarius]|uniref:Glycosyltransferase n=3 Tax=Companilactobacillus kimchii TaxID=2801452 RepID=A0ABR5NU69_9LACO|nr:glycosyl transferase [Companilactobacillus kimchii]KAE9561004.1 glycosyl transferase [Companilactobacillus kimchii]KRK51912.1 glycosyltransferase [Companilactobacillus kimchii DSM 13961 = JCM 10707]OWF33795.1 Cellulose synthase (UDP-forming) [Companilactobacillus kimchii]GEO47731.1 glycosyl transferase [Companilactobacillus paralimentarius]